jgi:iron complex transport system substrate-binding protein
MRTSIALLLGCSVAAMAQNEAPRRIISIIPAVTEILFAIGAGPNVVAVGSFDDYPPEARNLQRVGALLDPDLERILALKPDLVAVYGSQQDLRRQLGRAGIATFEYRHAGLADVSRTIRDVGSRVGHPREADALVKTIQTRLASIRERVAGRRRPKTLIVFGREALALRGIYANGGVGFLQDMLTEAGGENIFADIERESVQATAELILSRRPEIIIELRIGEISIDKQNDEIAVWHRLTSLPAVQSRRVFFVTDARTVVPGPRVAEGTELIARLLHPEAFKQEEVKSGREFDGYAARDQSLFVSVGHQPLDAAAAAISVR